MLTEIQATFPGARQAREAHLRLIEEGLAAGEMSLAVAAPSLAEETAREGRVMWRIVVIIVLASAAGTVIGAAFGAALALTVGPDGASGLIIQVVSWAIFAHLLIGMWAGYLLLADRSEREIGRARPVVLTVRCDSILRGPAEVQRLEVLLRDLGAAGLETRRDARVRP